MTNAKEKSGWIYVFTTSMYNGLVKVGKTTKHPEVRAEGLYNHEAVLSNFQVEWAMKVPDIVMGEAIAHAILKKYHYKKEFFHISVEQAISIVQDKLKSFFKIEINDIIIHRGNKIQEYHRKSIFALQFDFIDTEKQELNQLKNKLKEAEEEIRRLRIFLVGEVEIYFEIIWNKIRYLANLSTDSFEEIGKISFGFIEIKNDNNFTNWIITNEKNIVLLDNEREILPTNENNNTKFIRLNIPFNSYDAIVKYATHIKIELNKYQINCGYLVAETAKGYAAFMQLEFPDK